ncbi:MAG TPA: GNAT family N-acetyltransferase [Mycobacteriales bacterium]
MLRLAGPRLLDDRDIPAVRALLDSDPVANCFVSARVEAVGLAPWRLGGEMWGYGGGRIEAICFSGANLVPIGPADTAVRAFAERARRQGRRCSSIVGSVETVRPLWDLLRPHWGAARDVRSDQPLLAISGPPATAPDPKVRRVRPEELDVIMPACVAMFTEEVGVSPLSVDGGAAYRARVRDLVEAGRSYARIENGQVLYKAELGAVSRSACQVQGVWVHPDRRGRGLGAAGTAAVVVDALATTAPVVSLYVNDYNAPARAAYRRVGFTQVGSFMSVLF